MLTRMTMKCDGVSEPPSEYNQSGDNEDEHRKAEHEHDEEPELSKGCPLRNPPHTTVHG